MRIVYQKSDAKYQTNRRQTIQQNKKIPASVLRFQKIDYNLRNREPCGDFLKRCLGHLPDV
jgi:hypothetical protein